MLWHQIKVRIVWEKKNKNNNFASFSVLHLLLEIRRNKDSTAMISLFPFTVLAWNCLLPLNFIACLEFKVVSPEWIKDCTDLNVTWINVFLFQSLFFSWSHFQLKLPCISGLEDKVTVMQRIRSMGRFKFAFSILRETSLNTVIPELMK